jgi:tRNA(fMet)-specific endonuclease VapC
MAYLIDSDRLIDALAGRADAARLLDSLPPHEVRVSLVTYGEVLEAAFNSANPQAGMATVLRMLGATELLPVTEPIMVRFAEICAYLCRRGALIGDMDLIIGATALEHDLARIIHERLGGGQKEAPAGESGLFTTPTRTVLRCLSLHRRCATRRPRGCHCWPPSTAAV